MYIRTSRESANWRKKMIAQRIGNQYIIYEDDLRGIKIYGKAGRPPKEKELTKK